MITNTASPPAGPSVTPSGFQRTEVGLMAVNPKYFEKMSDLLDELILARKKQALDYKKYLAKIVELTKQVKKPETKQAYPAEITTAGLRSLYDNLDQDADAAVKVDTAIRGVKKAGWRGHKFKEREVRNAIESVLGSEDERVDAIFDIVKEPKNGY